MYTIIWEGTLGNVLQNTIHVFFSIKVSSGEYRLHPGRRPTGYRRLINMKVGPKRRGAQLICQKLYKQWYINNFVYLYLLACPW